MSLLDKLNLLEEQHKLRTSVTTSDELQSQSQSQSQPQSQPQSQSDSSLIDSQRNATQDTEEPFLAPLSPSTLRKHSADLWDTTVQAGIKPNQLVWAPYYRIKDKLMPARVCTPEETVTVAHIPLRVPADEVAVEFICMERVPETRILCVFRRNVVPYWSSVAAIRSSTQSEEELPMDQWNQEQTDLMYKALHSKYSKRMAEEVFHRSLNRAREFLLFARANMSEHKGVIGNSKENGSPDFSLGVSRPKATPPTRTEAPTVDIATLSTLARTSSAPLEHLSIGDDIVYYDAMFPDKKCETKVVGFSKNSKVPLILENEDVLRSNVVIKRKASGGFHKISAFSFAGQTSCSIGKRGQQAAALEEEPSTFSRKRKK